MKHDGEEMLLRVFVGESDRWQGRPLAEAIVHRAREAGLAGATVLRGLLGYGAHRRIHTTAVLRLSDDLPLVVEVVDGEERIQAFLPLLDEMFAAGAGLVTLERVRAIRYGPAP